MSSLLSTCRTSYYRIKRNIIKQSLLNFLFVRVKCRKIWLGGPGSGFFVCPDLLPLRKGSTINQAEDYAKSICYSAGVGDNISFDLSLHERFDMREILLFDPTPVTIEWIAQQDLPTEFRFFPYGINDTSGRRDFYLANTAVASSALSASMILDGNKGVTRKNSITIQVHSLGDIAKENGHHFVDVLKMDIEGSEFGVIESLRNLEDLRFGQLCIEFHQRFFPNRWKKLRKAIRTLSDCGYRCFSVNWNMQEFSFLDQRLLKGIRH